MKTTSGLLFSVLKLQKKKRKKKIISLPCVPYLSLTTDKLVTLISNSAVKCIFFERQPSFAFIMPMIHQQLDLPKARGGEGSQKEGKETRRTHRKGSCIEDSVRRGRESE